MQMRRSIFQVVGKRVIRTMCRGHFEYSLFLSNRKYSIPGIRIQQSHVGIVQMQLLFVHPLVRSTAQVDVVRQLTGTSITITSRRLPVELALQQVLIIRPAVARILITQHHQQAVLTRNVLE
jgi:hypothetical protein